jgi:hypothetical protein
MAEPLPKDLHKEIAALARKLAKEYRTVFAEDFGLASTQHINRYVFPLVIMPS